MNETEGRAMEHDDQQIPAGHEPWAPPVPPNPAGVPRGTAATPTGPTGVAPPAPPAPPAGPTWAVPDVVAAHALPTEALPTYALPDPPSTAAPRRGAAGVAIGVFAAFALLVGSAFALVAWGKPDGAESPEAAVRQLFDAIDREDAIGVMSILPENERDILQQPLIDIVGELQRLGVLSQFNLDQVPGADVTVNGLTVTATSIGGRSDLSAVDVTGGTITGKVIPDAVPLGATLRKIITEDFDEKIDIKPEEDTEDLGKAKLRLVTVEDDGGWHVSIAYSIAEAIRNDRGSVPVLGGGPVPVGADSPEGAVSGMAEAALQLDVERVIGMLDPNEAKALYEYAPLFLPDAKKGIDEMRQEGWTARVHRLDTTASGEGDVRQVKTTGFDIETSGNGGEKFRLSWDGTCFHTEQTYKMRKFTAVEPYPYDPSKPGSTYPGSSRSGSTEELKTSSSDTCPGKDNPDDNADDTELGRATADMALPNGFAPQYTVTVVEVNGRWYVSPTRTILDNVVAGLRQLTPQQLEEWGKRLAEQQKNRNRAYRSVGTAIPAPPGSYPYPYPGSTVPRYEEPTTTTTRTRTTQTRPVTVTTRSRSATTGMPGTATTGKVQEVPGN